MNRTEFVRVTGTRLSFHARGQHAPVPAHFHTQRAQNRERRVQWSMVARTAQRGRRTDYLPASQQWNRRPMALASSLIWAAVVASAPAPKTHEREWRTVQTTFKCSTVTVLCPVIDDMMVTSCNGVVKEGSKPEYPPSAQPLNHTACSCHGCYTSGGGTCIATCIRLRTQKPGELRRLTPNNIRNHVLKKSGKGDSRPLKIGGNADWQ